MNGVSLNNSTIRDIAETLGEIATGPDAVARDGAGCAAEPEPNREYRHVPLKKVGTMLVCYAAPQPLWPRRITVENVDE